jgi:hypothetical protein
LDFGSTWRAMNAQQKSSAHTVPSATMARPRQPSQRFFAGV